jgi:hypothetical protein
LTELSANKTLHLQSASKELDTFWLVRREVYPELVREELEILILFASYLREIRFSSMATMKTKHGNRLSLDNDLFLRVSTIEPLNLYRCCHAGAKGEELQLPFILNLSTKWE